MAYAAAVMQTRYLLLWSVFLALAILAAAAFKFFVQFS